jgi:hypothetical protein
MWPRTPLGWWDEGTRTLITYELDFEEQYGEPEILKRVITDEEANRLRWKIFVLLSTE